MDSECENQFLTYLLILWMTARWWPSAIFKNCMIRDTCLLYMSSHCKINITGGVSVPIINSHYKRSIC